MTSHDSFEYIGPTSISVDEKNEVTEGQAKDERDLGTLEKVAKLLAERKAHYLSINAVDTQSKVLDATQQIVVAKHMVMHLSDLENMVEKAINKVKEG